MYDWAKERDDTIVLVTADHETGGFTINEPENNDELTDEERYELPLTYYWTTSGHASISVNCYVYGANIDFSKYSLSSNTLIKNTDIFQIMKQIVMQN